MKIRKIYNDSTSIEDLSKDRVHLNLSYQEWNKIKTLVEMASWNMYEYEKHTKYVLKLAKNIKTMFKNAQDLEPIWTNKDGVVTK